MKYQLQRPAQKQKMKQRVFNYQQKLANILSSNSTPRVKLALLKSLKEDLQIRLTNTVKQIMIEDTKQNRNRKVIQGGVKRVKKSQESNQTCLRVQSVSSSKSQQNQRVITMLSLCQLFDHRVKLSHRQLQLQRLWQKSIDKIVVEDGSRTQDEEVMRRTQLNKNMVQLLIGCVSLKERVGVQLDCLLDLLRILKVKYSQVRVRVFQQKRKDCGNGRSNKMKKRVGLLGYSDENSNQILVNM